MIKVLPEAVARAISAHQIIERPESVVKELVENSLDAGAKRIDIHLAEGGLEAITVEDDGLGIPADDLELATERFATSKISNLYDLNNIQTYGFRGEGLFAIKECSKLTIISSVGGVALKLSWAGKDLISRDFLARSRGTTVIVEDLFWNVPARRKFLSSAQSEFRKVKSLVVALGLANPDVDFGLYHEGDSVLMFNQAVNRFVQIFGNELAFNEIESERLKVSALLGLKSLGQKGPKFIFVNKRPVWDRGIQRAISEALSQVAKNDNDACGYVSITLDSRETDFNVHPNKLEVKFVNPDLIFRTVYRCVSGLKFKSAVSFPPLEFYVREESQRKVPGCSPVNKRISTRFSETQNLFSPAFADSSFSREPEFLGVTQEGFFIYKHIDEIWIVDPHAAEERIIYEKLKADFMSIKDSQSLLHPIEIDNNFSETTIEQLKEMGFSFDNLGRLIKCPSIVLESLRWDLVELKFFMETVTQDFEWDKLVFKLAALVACKRSFKLGDSFSSVDAIQFGKKLVNLDNQVCPHGRPFKFVIKDRELGRFFQRT